MQLFKKEKCKKKQRIKILGLFKITYHCRNNLKKINFDKDNLAFIKTPILPCVKEQLELNFSDNNKITQDEIENYYKYYEKNKTLVDVNKPFIEESFFTQCIE